MFLWPFVLFNSAVSFTKQDFESMDSSGVANSIIGGGGYSYIRVLHH